MSFNFNVFQEEFWQSSSQSFFGIFCGFLRLMSFLIAAFEVVVVFHFLGFPMLLFTMLTTFLCCSHSLFLFSLVVVVSMLTSVVTVDFRCRLHSFIVVSKLCCFSFVLFVVCFLVGKR